MSFHLYSRICRSSLIGLIASGRQMKRKPRDLELG
jgi:hypothetical protein